MNTEKNTKREVSTFIPYKISGDKVCFFLQKRDSAAKILPGYLGFFGGGVELGETPSSALEREIGEELGLKVEGYKLFSRYESLKVINNVFILKVVDTFERTITVREGAYGAFLSLEDVPEKEKICDSDRLVLTQIEKTLKREFTW